MVDSIRPRPELGDVYKHEKTGKLYIVIAGASGQCADDTPWEQAAVVVYMPVDFPRGVYVRRAIEFQDGRFTFQYRSVSAQPALRSALGIPPADISREVVHLMGGFEVFANPALAPDKIVAVSVRPDKTYIKPKG